MTIENQSTSEQLQSLPESSKARILIVDDDFEIGESMRYALEANGYEVMIARDGNQGLALVEKHVPNLLVLDMMMPKRSGFLVLEQLRRQGNDSIKVIMVTANEGNRHKAYAELLGVNDYIRKPFAMDRLIDSVRNLLAGGKAAGESDPICQSLPIENPDGQDED